MGREWLYWVGGGGAATTAAGTGRRPSTRRGKSESSSPGCMCAVFQLFDLHPFHLPLNHQQHPDNLFLQEEATISKGAEAPRNSLELDDSIPLKEEENLNFPANMKIKTRISNSCSKSRTEDFTSESSSSPGLKTPSLVARLMGLELLPENNSPTFSTSSSKLRKKSHFSDQKQHKKQQSMNLQGKSSRYFSDDDISVGARSLPETPRISSARRSDVEYHRLSLQINKENRSPGHYAKQIVKQVRESVSRRVGLDITNIKREKEEIFIRRDENLVLSERNNYNSKILGENSIHEKQSITSSFSPKLRFSDSNKNKQAANSGNKSPKISSSSSSDPLKHQVITRDFKKVEKKLPTRDITKKKEEPFVRSSGKKKANLMEKKSKKAPLSSELLKVKKDPSPPATKLPQKQSQVSDALSSKRNTQLSCSTSHSYNLQTDKIFTVLPDNTNGCATTASAAAAAEYKHYIQRILKRTGIIDKVTPLTLGKWHTPSHPLDPSIFYYLELFHSTATSSAVLSRRCNRKLIFQLVDELLAEILRPHFEFKFWVSPITGDYDRVALADQLSKKIESFPAANCQVLEDIDSLIDKDLRKWRSNGFLEEEGERLVCEIEGEIMESLLLETVALVGGRTAEEQRQRLRDVTWEAFM